ncbi:hypothetical protein HU200_042578 [Digitaria exilis]|uniref:Glycosyltransferase n=1 Tax=Digitaria exilis TaxID=1010633 RepID=A0A835EFL8_9POAL|nr:hypothetical protein HU200_042578 [Digitaria exilis]
MSSPQPHFLVLTFPFQGHIAPALRLAKRLLAATPDALVTFSTTEVAHRRMFPAKPDGAEVPAEEHGGRLEFLPFSDGTEAGYVRSTDPGAFNSYMASFHAEGARTVAEIVDALAAPGRPPVAVFVIYFHYFHGHADVVAEHRHDPSFVVELPGLMPLTIGDLPNFLTDAIDPSDFFHSVFNTFHDLMETLDKESPKATVLVNTCQELELSALAAVGAHHVLPVGPVLPPGDVSGIFKQDDESEYMEWLDAKPENSVVYVSFGSLATMAREQLDELLLGLEESERPYLCVIRKDIKVALVDREAEMLHERLKNGMVVEWCDQVRVLSHAAVGCFVTHCGWNSVLESVASGVPMVCVPRMSDQRMNAQLVVRDWRVGVRAQIDEGGVLREAELRRCIEEVMDNPEVAAEVGKWKRIVVEATGKGGSSDRNLMAFNGARSVV